MNIVKLRPSCKDYIWGGSKLKAAGKISEKDPIAECWEFSMRDDGPSFVDSGEFSGRTLMEVATPKDLGEKASRFPFFPVLIKLIDSASNLSVQVHPSDAYALKNENSLGKTEMWFILDADEGCGIYAGLKKDSCREEVEKAVKDGTIMDLLNFFQVKPGECYFIESGTIHAIGAGVTLIEIQQNSNLTYRLYDYGRLEKDGKPRELHLEKALNVIDYGRYEKHEGFGDSIGKCEYFASYDVKVREGEVISSEDSFSTITFIEGEGSFEGMPFKKYDTFFIPAGKKGHIQSQGARYILTRIE